MFENNSNLNGDLKELDGTDEPIICISDLDGYSDFYKAVNSQSKF